MREGAREAIVLCLVEVGGPGQQVGVRGGGVGVREGGRLWGGASWRRGP